MRRLDRDVGDLQHQAAVADHAAHADDATLVTDHDAEDRPGEADGCAGRAFGAESSNDPQAQVVVGGGRLITELAIVVHSDLPPQARRTTSAVLLASRRS